MKTVVLHAVDHALFDNRLAYARELAIACGAHLAVNYPIPVYGPVAADMSGGIFTADFIGRMLEIEREQAAKVKAKVATHLADLGTTWQWEQNYGDSARSLIDASKLADLVVVGPSDPDNVRGPIPAPVAGSLALHGCAPVLVVPARAAHFDVKAPVVVGWNGSAEAARAIKAALPLLKMAHHVIIAEVSAEKDAALPDLDIGSYLARHGVSARMSQERPQGSPAQTLTAVARDAGAHLMVVGAYGRPRLIEYVFGGATRELLADPQLPVLMMH
jgi:nucleotide-binding universal stress UspA family protein